MFSAIQIKKPINRNNRFNGICKGFLLRRNVTRVLINILLNSLPLTRKKIVSSKYVGGILIALLIVLLSYIYSVRLLRFILKVVYLDL
ncbi:ABC-2 transporter permease [Planococcus sp. SIMBA_143]